MLDHVMADRGKFSIDRRREVKFSIFDVLWIIGSNFCQAVRTQASGSGQNYCPICYASDAT
jgi:hypothetical protein